MSMQKGLPGRLFGFLTGFRQCEYAPGVFDHEWEYHEDTFGDPEVINGTGIECWLECCGCGETKPAGPEDIPDFEEYF